MAMAKEEVLKTVRNYEREIKNSMATLDMSIYSLVAGFRSEVPDEMDSLKGMMDFVKGKADDIKSTLDQWPE